MKRTIWMLPALALLLCGVGQVKADFTTISIKDIGSFSGYTDYNTGDTFSGTGFLGLYPATPNDFGAQGPAFAHLLGLENYNGVYSETEMQANISALHGATINSATLSYVLLNGGPGSQGVTVTSFDTNGTLGFNATPPTNLGTTTFTSNGLSPNSVDVTSLVSSRVNSGANWLGLFLTPNGPGDNFQWTYTSGYNGDEAQVRLTINYTPGGNNVVPEPSSLILLGIGAFCMGGAAWRRRNRASV